MGNVVSLSGGKDSTAMLLMMIERGEPIDDIVFWDSGVEFPQMYAHLERLERETGLSITRLHMKGSFEWWGMERELTRGAHKGQKGYGWPRPNARWCTELKQRAINHHFKGMDVVHCVGIAADENRPLDPAIRYPLVEWGITEDQALEYCLDRGYDWGGLYEHFRRVSCYLCPLKGLDELRNIRRHYPDLWENMLRMDAKSPNTFKIKYSLSELESRFEAEDRQMELDI